MLCRQTRSTALADSSMSGSSKHSWQVERLLWKVHARPGLPLLTSIEHQWALLRSFTHIPYSTQGRLISQVSLLIITDVMFWLVEKIEVLMVFISLSGCLIAVSSKPLQHLHSYAQCFTRHASVRLQPLCILFCQCSLKSGEASARVHVARKLVRCSCFGHRYGIFASTVLSRLRRKSALCRFASVALGKHSNTAASKRAFDSHCHTKMLHFQGQTGRGA